MFDEKLIFAVILSEKFRRNKKIIVNENKIKGSHIIKIKVSCCSKIIDKKLFSQRKNQYVILNKNSLIEKLLKPDKNKII